MLAIKELGLPDLPTIASSANALLHVEPGFDFETVNTYEKIATLIARSDQKVKQTSFLDTLFLALNYNVSVDTKLATFKECPTFRMASNLRLFRPLAGSNNFRLRAPGSKEDIKRVKLQGANEDLLVALEPTCFDARVYSRDIVKAYLEKLEVFAVDSRDLLVGKKKNQWQPFKKVEFMKVSHYISFLTEIVKANEASGSDDALVAADGADPGDDGSDISGEGSLLNIELEL